MRIEHDPLGHTVTGDSQEPEDVATLTCWPYVNDARVFHTG